MDPLVAFKLAQKEGWAHFAPLEAVTTGAAVRLVRHAGLRPQQQVLDVGCGTGVVAVTAARLGARVSGLDLTPELLERARAHALLAQVEIDWREGDVEAMPFSDATFDAVVSQFGHMFAPRAEVAVKEMLRVLKPGGTIAFSTWPPELFTGRMMALVASFMPAPPPGFSSPPEWGESHIIRERLGGAVKNVVFDRAAFHAPALSPQHHRMVMERAAGPVFKLVQALEAGDSGKLAEFRGQYDALAAEYFEDNAIRQSYLITRATKV